MIHDCQDCDDLLDAYLASELLVETTDQVIRHLASCARCRREARNRAHLRRLLSRVRAVDDVPPGLAGRVLTRIERDAASARDARPRQRRTPRGPADARERDDRHERRDAIESRERPPRDARRAPRPATPPRPRPRADRLPRSPWRHLTAGAAAVTLATLIALGWWHETPLSAAELLRQSSDVERAAASHADAVVHRVMRLEVRALPAGTLVGRQRIEVWQSPGAHVRAKRAFDEARRLVAGEWTRADGSAAIYARGEPPRVATPEAAAHPAWPSLLDSEEVWRMDLSAADVRAFAGETRAGIVDVKPAAYVISYRDIAIDGDRTAALTITLNRPQLRPIRQTVIVAGPSGRREYRLEEERFAELRREDIRAAVFEPEAELLGPVTARAAVPASVAAPAAPRRAAVAVEPPMDPGLEVAALYQLHQAHACLLDHASVRAVDGRALYIDAVTEASRKPLLLAALKPLESDPHVHLSITDAAEANAAAAAPRGSEGDVRREIETAPTPLARRVLERADDARRHAEALESLVARGVDKPAWRADLNATATWLSMIRDHGRGLRQQIAWLREELGRTAVAPPGASAGRDPASASASATAAHDIADLAATARALAAAAAAQQARVRAAFAPAAGPQAAAPPSIDAELWSILARAERLAASLDDPWILN